MDWYCLSLAMASELRTLSRMLRSDERQSMLMPATWMMDLKGKRPAEVSTAWPRGMGPSLANYLKGRVPARLLMAPETP